MNAQTLINSFEEHLAAWKEAEAIAINEALTYEREYHEAMAASDAKNAEGRKAQAVLAVADIIGRKQRAELEAQEARHRVEFFKRLAGSNAE